MNKILFDPHFLSSQRNNNSFVDFLQMDKTQLREFVKFIHLILNEKPLCSKNKKSDDTSIIFLKDFYSKYKLWHYHLYDMEHYQCNNKNCPDKIICTNFGKDENKSGFADSKVIHYINKYPDNIIIISTSLTHKPFPNLNQSPLHNRIKAVFHDMSKCLSVKDLKILLQAYKK